MTTIENYLAYRNAIVTCDTCGVSGSRYSSNVQMFHSDGSRYYGSPLTSRMASIIVQGNACGACVRSQAMDKVVALSATYVPSEMANRPTRVNEMP